MAVDQSIVDQAAGSLLATINSQAQGHAFVMETGRINMLEGKVSMREALSQRIIGESGGGQARAQLPAMLGGVPTALPKS